jgi:hypothetical protein
MKRGNVIITVIVFVFLGLSTNAQITFQKTYGGLYSDEGSTVQQTSDGGYIIIGSGSFTSGSDIYLIKTNSYGEIIWTSTYGNGADQGLSVLQTNNNGYILTNWYQVMDSLYGICIIRTNSLGDTLWTKTYVDKIFNSGESIQHTTDGGYIIGGGTSTFNQDTSQVYLIKIDSLGDTLWTRKYGGSGYSTGSSIHQTFDKGFIIAGSTNNFGVGDNDVYLIKTDSLGDTLWSKTYGGDSSDYASSIIQTPDSGYFIVGYTKSFGSGGYDAYLIRTNSLGDTLWTKTYGGTGDDEAESIYQTNDGGFIITGYTNSLNSGIYSAFLIKLNSIGDTLWTKLYGGVSDCFASSIEQTSDKGYIIAGSSTINSSNGNVYLIKTDSLGNSGCDLGNASAIIGSTSTQITNPATQISFGGNRTYPPIAVSNGGTATTICFSSDITEIPFDNSSISIYPNPFNLSTTLYINGETSQNDYSLYIYRVPTSFSKKPFANIQPWYISLNF